MNDRVQAAAGINGTVVILSAWCRRCKQQAMPDRYGSCSWCFTVIVDEQTLSASDMLAQISGREPTAVLRAAAAPAGGKPRAVPSRPGRKPRGSGTNNKWTQATVIAAIRKYADEHGRPPFASESRKANGLADAGRCTDLFGSFSAAVEAAGFPRPARGRPKASGGDLVHSPAPPPEELLEALKVA